MNRLWRGLLPGLAGSLAMHLFRKAWERGTRNRSEDGIFGFDREADVNSARLVAVLLSGHELDEKSGANLGMILHYAFGTTLGCACSLLKLETFSPPLLGGILWLVVDEIPISLAGISNPRRKSFLSHTGAFLAHLIFAKVFVRFVIQSRG